MMTSKNLLMLRAEIHVHSTFSDGKDSVRKIVDKAVELKLDILSITDHDTVAGSLSALEYIKDENIPVEVIPGVEVTTSDGHLLIYGVKNEIDRGMSLKETVEEAKRHNGVCIIPHPFQVERKGVLRVSLFKWVDGIEVFNAKYFVGLFNFLSKRCAEYYRMAVTAGSDAHCLNEMGHGITLLKNDFYRSILNKTTEIECRKIPALLWFKCSVRRKA